MTTFKCDACLSAKDDPCILLYNENNSVIEHPGKCPHGSGDANWQKTEDFEIVEKKKINHASSKENARIMFRNSPFPTMCALCDWREQVASKIDGYDALNQALERTFFCSAQAGSSCISVYGNENCIALYSQKETGIRPEIASHDELDEIVKNQGAVK